MASYPTTDLVHSDTFERSYATDVLVIGGSVAGCWAALTARKAGARVIVVEKGEVGHAGVVAKASGSGFYLTPGDAEKNRKLIRSRHDAACGLDDLGYIERVYEESYHVGLDLKALGFQSNHGAADLDGGPPSLLNFQGPYALLFLRRQLLEAGVTVLDYCPAVELLAADGVVAGAAGHDTRSGQSWSIRAGAVILATGGNAFLSGAMGTDGTTGDGHLMAAEAGARFASMEFSGHYGISPKDSPTTKGFWYGSATFYDNNGRELSGNGWESVADVARAVMETGGAYASMNRASASVKAFARSVSSIYDHFRNIGVDPFTDRFPLELRYEGLIRSAGGLIVDRKADTGVAGLFAAGDITERTHMCGAAMSGGGPAIAWCVVSAKWAGESAVAHANAVSRHSQAAQTLGGIGLRPRGSRAAASSAGLRKRVQDEILPIEKNVFRTLSGLSDSLQKLEAIWDEASETLAPDADQDPGHVRETAALLAGARWIYRSAEARRETRGLHRLQEFPTQDSGQQYRLTVGGLDDVRVAPVTDAPGSA